MANISAMSSYLLYLKVSSISTKLSTFLKCIIIDDINTFLNTLFFQSALTLSQI